MHHHLRFRIVSGLLALTVGAVTLTACSAGHTAVHSGRVADESTVVVGLAAAPASLDFTTSSGAAIPQALVGNVYEGLVEISDQGTIEPKLATSWDLSEDRTLYTFHLRDGVHFSNGDLFTAETARFSIERVKSDAWTNGLKAGMKNVESVTVLDPLTLQVKLATPSNSWLWSMGTLIGMMMTPNGVSADQLATKPVGTGPFTVDKYAVGQSLTMSARKDYWGTPAASQHVAFRYIADSTALANALRSGDIDAIEGFTAVEMVNSLRKDPRFVVEQGSTPGKVVLSMNSRRAPFNDLRVRQAVMYAVDRQAVIDTAWAGFGVNTGGVPAPPTDPWSYVSDQYPFDPQRARELVAQAGAEGATIEFTVPTLPYATRAAELIVSQLKDVGLNAKIVSQEFPAVWLAGTYTQHDYDMSIVNHAEARDIPNLYGNPKYYIGFDDEQTRQLLAAADQAPPADYADLMKKAEQRILDQAAADTLFVFPNVVVRSANVTGLPVTVADQGLRLATVKKAA